MAVAAIAAGMLGVGGGMVLGPIFLELGLLPGEIAPRSRGDRAEVAPRCDARSEAVERRVLTRATWMIAEVSAATSTMMVLFMSSSTVAQFVIFGMIDMEYAAFYGDSRAQNLSLIHI